MAISVAVVAPAAGLPNDPPHLRIVIAGEMAVFGVKWSALAMARKTTFLATDLGIRSGMAYPIYETPADWIALV